MNPFLMGYDCSCNGLPASIFGLLVGVIMTAVNPDYTTPSLCVCPGIAYRMDPCSAIPPHCHGNFEVSLSTHTQKVPQKVRCRVKSSFVVISNMAA